MKKIMKATVILLSLTAVFAGSAFAERDNIIAPDAEYVDDYTIKGPVNYADIDPVDKSGNINVVIEIPAGTNAKWEVSADTGNIIWEFKNDKPRVVNYEGGYPANYGTVPKTLLSKEWAVRESL